MTRLHVTMMMVMQIITSVGVCVSQNWELRHCEQLMNKCNCSYIKSYNKSLSISCLDSANNCTWHHIINGTPEQIKERTDNGGILLLKNYTLTNYGNYIATNSSNHSCFYLVVPTNTECCDNCTGIKIDGTRRNNNETLCKVIGDDLTIEAYAPGVFNVSNVTPSLNDVFSDISDICDCEIDPLKCICSNLESKNNGVYSVNITLKIYENGPDIDCHNNVTIKVQSLPQIYNVTVADQCVSDLTIEWIPADYNRACGNISYAVEISSITNSSLDESNKRNFSVNNNHMNFTRLNSDTAYMVRVKTNLSGRIEGPVEKQVHTVNVSSARPSKPELNVTKPDCGSVSPTPMVIVSWKPVKSLYCGHVLCYLCSLTNNNKRSTKNFTAYTNLTCIFTKLIPDTSYDVSVAAINRAGMGDFAVVNFTTCTINDTGDSNETSGSGFNIEIIISIIVVGIIILVYIVKCILKSIGIIFILVPKLEETYFKTAK